MWKFLLVLFVLINIIWIASQSSYTKNLVAAFQATPTPSATPFPSAEIPVFIPTSKPSPTPIISPVQIKQPGDKELLHSQKYVYQTYNNCGPATLSMLLDFYGINATQQEIADQLRPYNNPQGYNDDKSVTLDELASYSEQKGLTTFKRPGGDINKLKQFVANGIPVITITWIDEKGGFGHYRIIKGFDENKQQVIEDDSIFGQNQPVTYNEFNRLWQIFNYDYLVIVRPEQAETVKAILGEEANEQTAYQNALKRSESETGNFALFNQAINNYYLGNYSKTTQIFEKVHTGLPYRLLWYQIEPIEAYLKQKNYDQVFALTNQIFQSGDPSFSELYYLRGQSYLETGEPELAKKEFEKAVLYNKNYQPALQQLQQ